MNILIISDAWLPQTNGVVRTLQNTQRELGLLGHQVKLVSPAQFRTIPCPTYKEIRLAIGLVKSRIQAIVEDFKPDYIHIATEGPLGLAGRAYCTKHNKAFTTSFHTKFPEYVQARFGFPSSWSYSMLRWFHKAARQTMVATPSLREELAQRSFGRMVYWTRGVDIELFKPRPDRDFLALPRPIFLFVGRVAVEKNIEAFLRLDLPGSKCVVGDGPLLHSLQHQYPDVHFPGEKQGEELAQYFAAADVFVFPSLTDTFGLVMLEAMASGVPVAAFPVTGPRDVVTDPKTGVLDQDLKQAALKALELDSTDCRRYAENYSWAACTRQFVENLVPL
jgi:glycosyltransferase involved in cell wall biosynthesis